MLKFLTIKNLNLNIFMLFNYSNLHKVAILSKSSSPSPEVNHIVNVAECFN